MILDLPTVPNEWHTIIVTVAVKEVATSNKIAINALTSSDLSNSFVFTEPLVSYVALDSGPFQAYLMAKYVVPWYINSTLMQCSSSGVTLQVRQERRISSVDVRAAPHWIARSHDYKRAVREGRRVPSQTAALLFGSILKHHLLRAAQNYHTASDNVPTEAS